MATSQPMRKHVGDYITNLQKTIVTALESYSPACKFRCEEWIREEGGGGVSYTFPPLGQSSNDSHSIEKAGVNISTIHGMLPPEAIKQMSTAHAALKDLDRSHPFFATGLSLVIHPRNPHVPGIHTNYRYFEVLDSPLPAESGESSDSEPKVIAWWFGVITDMTPFYVNEDDFTQFHNTLKGVCDQWSTFENHQLSLYHKFKESCDGYLYTPHRKEHRGIGGVRFDDMDSDAMRKLLLGGKPDLPEDVLAHLTSQESVFRLVRALADSFLPSFQYVLDRRKDERTSPSERRWQLLRRGRAVEFNLVIDRGTKFGLAAPGVGAENVLMGLPPEARWEYCTEVGEQEGSEEAKMMEVLRTPKDWASL
ncbi:hypothetical protein HYDPIDRAFT_169845 [Hydnomerulius pinastri MD-312]|uniref:coproporphyrinogen oxidase n=1 Tax=Hydnomerulius pinastri MD-312 TaxID=994086 RepID=A0A0C9V634_9AGAM|nr:hypothetical protein HYDPIDRAFT_169845 [Hydnomerulius pinastri MD-312]